MAKDIGANTILILTQVKFTLTPYHTLQSYVSRTSAVQARDATAKASRIPKPLRVGRSVDLREQRQHQHWLRRTFELKQDI